jgi:hypothetical protein
MTPFLQHWWQQLVIQGALATVAPVHGIGLDVFKHNP